MIDSTTQAWIRNVSDERAVANGCRFDVARGAWAVWWIERFCRLYEGEGASEPLILCGCHECDYDLPPIEDFNADCNVWQERARRHNQCFRAGHFMDWQYECHMRLYGWIRHSEKWDREVRRFREASIWIAKKNKKSPSLAANGLYLWAGDGEPGQHVFLAAKDGQQSREIAGKHVLEMLAQSEELKAESITNLTLCQITHLPSRPTLKPLSSSNSRTQQSKEGLNGSILVDETHVVDREFMGRISRAGISRAEPLLAEFSTAGDNPESYGKERFDYALDVVEGKRTDESLFVAIYAAPQDLSDEALDADPMKYGRMANPAMGHTVDPQEFLRDYEKSKAGPLTGFNEFKKYRLNIWQKASNPWLKPEDWAKCGCTFDRSELVGKRCFAALDLSLRWDTTAFVLVFPWGADDDGQQRYRLWPQFFLPRATAEKTKHLVPWLDWERAGAITLTDGNTTDFPAVRKYINEAASNVQIEQIGYDDRYAESFAQDLKDADGLPVQNYNQVPQNFLEPIGMMENLLPAGRLHHPNNPCLNWQAGHVQKNNKGMLEKPPESTHKKVDGIVALVMALGMALSGDGESVYESRGMLIL